jgi:hypothetical protein
MCWKRSDLVVLLALLGAGCVSLTPPPDFLPIEEGLTEYKAVSPDDARLWVREFDVPDQSDLSFWSKLLRTNLVDGRGYVLIEEGTAKDGADAAGVQYLFETTAAGEAHRYLLTVFFYEDWGDDTVAVVEYVAPKPIFEKYLAAVRAAIATLEP